MNIRYITIEREYGSGGTEIGRRLSEETGIPCYGKEITEAVSEKLGMTSEEIGHYEETVSNSFLYTVYAMAHAGTENTNMLSKEGHIFVAEQSAIQKIARNGRAVFLGHCASEALKHEKGVLKVYIRCSDNDRKKKRIIEEYSVEEHNAEKTKKRFDKKRANYFFANTAKRWDDMNNYDIVLDSAVLGIEGCIKLLKALVSD